jgi:flagellar export protein FliJ
MAFRFSLATVLRVRESVEKREELALQQIQFEIARVRRRIEELNSEIANKQDERNQALLKPVHAHHIQAILSEVNAASHTRQALLDSLQTLEQEQDLRMKAYQTARTNRQMLTDIMTQQLNAYEQEQVRSQQKSLDDIFAARTQRG